MLPSRKNQFGYDYIRSGNLVGLCGSCRNPENANVRVSISSVAFDDEVDRH